MAQLLEDKQKSGYIVGIELDEKTAQASYWAPFAAEAETLSTVEGAELYDFPLVLARRKLGGQWVFGREAELAAAGGEAEKIDALFAAARENRSVTLDNERLPGVPLLVLYLKKLLYYLIQQTAGAGVGIECIEALQITTDEPDVHTMRMLRELKEELNKSVPQIRHIACCTHAESMFRYLQFQPAEIRSFEVLAFWARDDKLVSFRHELNYNTSPFVASVVRTEEPPLPTGSAKARDEAFLRIAGERLANRTVTSVFLLGDGFSESWLSKSLDLICHGRRVFLGNNLFSRGAVLGMREKLYPVEDENTVFLGPDKILANVGIYVKMGGETHYHALIDAGTSWYDARASIDVLLDKDARIALEIMPLSGNGTRTEILELDGLPHLSSRERRTTRLSLELTMFSVDRVRLSVVDLGFGEFYPSSGEHWEKFIVLTPGSEAGARPLERGVITEPILCTGRRARNPYVFPFLEVRVSSVEELCYFIAKNDYLLTTENFPESFCDWLAGECLLKPLADELRELLRRKCSLVAFAGTILDYVRLYPEEEVSRIREVLRTGDAKDGAEKKLKIIEYLIREHRLAEAHRLIREFDRSDRHPVVLARLFYDEGVIYARLFHYRAAASCMEQAYTLSGDAQVKEAYLAALRLSMSEEEYIQAIGTRPELSPESLTLETRLGETLDLFAASADNHLVNTLRVYLDTGKLREFDEATASAEEEMLMRFRRATA
ncbi:MAG: hypothetical protein K6B72_10115 [Lachnospiraceae bacterium]|nr:hypothetical protein [Lachnospiraceae bacterium]